MLHGFKKIEKFYEAHTKVCFWSLAILVILPVSFIKIYDIDIWWHMLNGKNILSHFAWPDFSQYYFSPVSNNTDSLRYTFLGDIVFYLINALSGDVGLQVFRLSSVVLVCFLLRSMAGKKYKGWHLILLIILIAGTYQKQLIRNSLFGFMLTPILFWMWYQISARQKNGYLWILPLLLGVWSCLHGSYLFGFALTSLILAGDILDMIVERRPDIKKQTLIYFCVLFISFGAINAWNPTTMRYFSIHKIVNLFQTNVLLDQTKNAENTKFENPVSQTNQKKDSPGKEQGFWHALKTRLNNTIFKTSGSVLNSGDFMSPFDKLNRFYVWIALFSGILGSVMLIWRIRPVRFSTLIPFLGVVLVGLGYLRLCGYIPVVTAAIIFSSAGRNELKPFVNKAYLEKMSWVIVIVIIMLGIGNSLLGYPLKLGTRLHEFGIGRIPNYSIACPDKVLAEFKELNTFTTMATGGYLLYRWFPDKKVFADGFFAPHKGNVMPHLKLMSQKDINPDFLHSEYGIEVALIEHTGGSVMNNFLNSENWYARYMDTGMICFVYIPDFSSDIPIPELLCNIEDIDALSGFFKQSVVNTLHSISNSLFKKGRIKDGVAFEQKYAQLLEHTKQMVDPEFINVTQQLKLSGKFAYGLKNTKAQYYEYKHNAAAEQNDILKAVEYGEKVLESSNDRLPVMVNLAIAYSKLNKFSKSGSLLDRVIDFSRDNSEFWLQNKDTMSKLSWMLSLDARKKGQFIQAFTLADQANDINGGIITQNQLYQSGMDMVTRLNSENKIYQALIILEMMKKKFESSGRWLNDMAWQLYVVGKNDPKILEKARNMALKAVETMNLEQSDMVDLAYDTLAEISYQQGDTKAACKFIQMARTKAPVQRQSNYADRFDCN